MPAKVDRKAVILESEVDTLRRALTRGRYTNPARAVMQRLVDTFSSYEPYSVSAAEEEYGQDGEIEIDEGAVCSRAEDNPEHGLYVQAWVWVADAEEDQQ